MIITIENIIVIIIIIIIILEKEKLGEGGGSAWEVLSFSTKPEK